MVYFINFIGILFDVLTIAIIFRVILSWFSSNPTNRLAIILIQITEPILGPLRRIIPRAGMLDFSPMVAIIILQLISYLLRSLLS